MSAYETIYELITVVNLINEPKCLNIFEQVILGSLAKNLLPINLQILFDIWNHLDQLDNEVKHCIKMIDSYRAE